MAVLMGEEDPARCDVVDESRVHLLHRAGDGDVLARHHGKAGVMLGEDEELLWLKHEVIVQVQRHRRQVLGGGLGRAVEADVVLITLHFRQP
uniref:Uncharacterized protein n=1 Tax=Hordeum vulgare subsp. vulgare TaxID=112509 RepID=A0A8I6Y841_HORVV